jgi:hypothetical protein
MHQWESKVMTQRAKSVLNAFDELPLAERQEVLRELLRRIALSEHDAPSEAELMAAADGVFLELDRRKSAG